MKTKASRLITFMTWHNDYVSKPQAPTAVSFDPYEVSNVEDWCGSIKPGSKVTLKNKTIYLVGGVHADIVAAINDARQVES